MFDKHLVPHEAERDYRRSNGGSCSVGLCLVHPRDSSSYDQHGNGFGTYNNFNRDYVYTVHGTIYHYYHLYLSRFLDSGGWFDFSTGRSRDENHHGYYHGQRCLSDYHSDRMRHHKYRDRHSDRDFEFSSDRHGDDDCNHNCNELRVDGYCNKLQGRNNNDDSHPNAIVRQHSS